MEVVVAGGLGEHVLGGELVQTDHAGHGRHVTVRQVVPGQLRRSEHNGQYRSEDNGQWRSEENGQWRSEENGYVVLRTTVSGGQRITVSTGRGQLPVAV